MNKKVITVIALAAGIAAIIYKRNRNRIDEAAADAYKAAKDAVDHTERNIENTFS